MLNELKTMPTKQRNKTTQKTLLSITAVPNRTNIFAWNVNIATTEQEINLTVNTSAALQLSDFYKQAKGGAITSLEFEHERCLYLEMADGLTIEIGKKP